MSSAGTGRAQRILIGVVVAGAVVIAAIGFAGSYSAVRALAERKHFGAFAPFFPIGIDAGIIVLLALDLLLTWMRIPFPLLRQTAWLLTAATIAFNGAAAWPDPLGVGMHAVIPVLFVVAVEAARHAIGRIADITADKHMDGVRISRWLLAFPSTFRLWRRMKLWELRSYDEVIRMEQDRLVYESRLQARYGRNWRRRAPVEAMMPLKLARYGIPLTETAAADSIRPAPPAEAKLPTAEGPEASRTLERPSPADAIHRKPLPAQPISLEGETSIQTESRPDAVGTAWEAASPNDHRQEAHSAPALEPAARLEHQAQTSGKADFGWAAATDGLEHPEQPRWEQREAWTSVREEPPLNSAAAASAGARAAEQDEPSSVPARFPRQQSGPSPDGTEAVEAGVAEPGEPTQQLRGKAGVEALFLALPEKERALSANALAPRLAPQVNLSEGTTRKYLGTIIRSMRAVADIYWALPEEERQMPADSLAPRIAAAAGLSSVAAYTYLQALWVAEPSH